MKDFLKISKYAGMREDLVQAAGGNTSFKRTDSEMVVKASGYQLTEITEEEGFALVDYKTIQRKFLDGKQLDTMTEEEGNGILKQAFISGNRPSIETFLHSVTGKYTLHTHPIVVNVLTCRKSGLEELRSLFPEALIVLYEKPGIGLARTYFKAYLEHNKQYKIIFLANHGLVVSGESGDEVINITESVVDKICAYLGVDNKKNRMVTQIWKYFPSKVIWRVTDINVIEIYNKMGKWDHQFCPDGVVFLGKKFIEKSELVDLKTFISKNGEPTIVVHGKDLYIVADSVKKAMEIQSVLSFSGQVMSLNAGIECNLLNKYQQDELINWDAEKYRKQMK